MQIRKNYNNTACLMQLKLPQFARLLVWYLIGAGKQQSWYLTLDFQAEDYNEGYVAAQVTKKHGWLTY